MAQFELPLDVQCVGLGLPKPEKEFRFAPPRQWKFDFAWPDYKVALEIEGGAWTRGRHTRGAGYIRDMEKYSEAAILGWCVLRLTPTDSRNTGAALVDRALTMRGYRAQDAVVLVRPDIHGVVRVQQQPVVNCDEEIRKKPTPISGRGRDGIVTRRERTRS